MKRSVFTSLGFAGIAGLFVVASCGTSDVPNTPGGTSGKGGSSGSGGSAGTGGSTGGSGGSTGGSDNSGGSGGTTGGSGGTTGGSGGTTGGSGGTTGGSAGTTGGSAGTTGGSAGTGGATPDSGSTGGGSGSAMPDASRPETSAPEGGGGGTACATPASCIDDVAGQKSNYGFAFKDSFFITGCRGRTGHDCITVPGTCNESGATYEDKGVKTVELFPLGGDVGKTYAVTFTFNGISEGKLYTGGAWDTGMAPNAGSTSQLDAFYKGGTPDTSAGYNQLRLRVLDSTKKEVAKYFMNAFTKDGESHKTFLLAYTKTIDVPGGGFVEYLVHDSNCRAIDNCGSGTVPEQGCPDPRMVPNEPDLKVPAMYAGVATATLNANGGATMPWHAQISHLTVTKVVAK